VVGEVGTVSAGIGLRISKGFRSPNILDFRRSSSIGCPVFRSVAPTLTGDSILAMIGGDSTRISLLTFLLISSNGGRIGGL
jgi:hypothetical protein